MQGWARGTRWDLLVKEVYAARTMNNYWSVEPVKRTLMQPISISHSTSSLPPPALKSLRFDHEGTSSSEARLGERKVRASDSTFEGCGPLRVYQERFCVKFELLELRWEKTHLANNPSLWRLTTRI